MVKSLRRCSAVKSARLHTPTELSVGPRQQSPPSPSNHSPVVIKIVWLLPREHARYSYSELQFLLTLYPSSTLTIRPSLVQCAVLTPKGEIARPCPLHHRHATTSPSSCSTTTSSTSFDGAHTGFSTSVCFPAAPQCLHEPLGPHGLHPSVCQCPLHEGLSFSVSSAKILQMSFSNHPKSYPHCARHRGPSKWASVVLNDRHPPSVPARQGPSTGLPSTSFSLRPVGFAVMLPPNIERQSTPLGTG